MKPIFEQLAKDNPSIKFVHIDIDEARDKMDSKLKDVNSVPTFEVYKNGKLDHTFQGADVEALKKSVAKLKSGDNLATERPKEETITIENNSETKKPSLFKRIFKCC